MLACVDTAENEPLKFPDYMLANLHAWHARKTNFRAVGRPRAETFLTRSTAEKNIPESLSREMPGRRKVLLSAALGVHRPVAGAGRVEGLGGRACLVAVAQALRCENARQQSTAHPEPSALSGKKVLIWRFGESARFLEEEIAPISCTCFLRVQTYCLRLPAHPSFIWPVHSSGGA